MLICLLSVSGIRAFPPSPLPRLTPRSSPPCEPWQRLAPPVAQLAGAQAMRVTVPEGVTGGQPLQVQTPGGLMQTVVPDGLQPGDQFDILVPMAPDDDEDDDDAAAADPEMAGPEIQEVWLNRAAASEASCHGDSIRLGDVVVRMPEVASEAELQVLYEAGLAAVAARRESSGAPSTGRDRFAVADPTAFSPEVVAACEEILLRVLDRVDDQMPTVHETLFLPGDGWAARQPLNAQGEQPTEPPPEYLEDTCTRLRDLYEAGELEWSEGEPAINVYTANGYFGAHKDHLALTVLLPLTSPTKDFSGGGTGFWMGNRAVGEDPDGPPTKVLRPELGTALVFGGDVTHAGMPVEGGTRAVFVASFSTRTAASAEDRVGGLRCATAVSPDFKGSGDLTL